MSELLFPETTTYKHSYRPVDLQPNRTLSGPPEYSLYEYLPPEHPIKRVEPPQFEDADGLVRKEAPAQRIVPDFGAGETSCFGGVTINDLPDEKRRFFISQTYRPTYLDYAKYVRSEKKPDQFTRQDHLMLNVLDKTKPDLYDYGFGLPDKVCSAWEKVQARTTPAERQRQTMPKKMDNPFTDNPEKCSP
ncbi:Hypothetical protein NTJ_07976 [Nesidiocoris tenuis]|uniref:Uncharacterized protein n=1 Tax=Nesidiocoris tenuis TaxID=355587 RepID=A0ABN7AXG1_9HEMI|nr:Hypothetical protein NTJ_07976 [Nesidiocoris tenuis]